MKDLKKLIWSALRIKFLRAYVNVNQKMIAKESEGTEPQLYAIKILKKMITHPDSELMTAPISGTYYIHTKDVFSKIDECRVQIINGKYFYDIDMTLKQSDELYNFFKRVLEDKRKEMEKEIMEKTNRSLSKILDELNIEDNKVPSDFKTLEKPPIGLKPRIFILEQRISEINEAILRYQEVEKTIPDEWLKEKTKLEDEWIEENSKTDEQLLHNN